MAELMVEMVPGIEMVRMVNSGTEAVMSALRLARGPPAGTNSSNLRAATMDTVTACW